MNTESPDTAWDRSSMAFPRAMSRGPRPRSSPITVTALAQHERTIRSVDRKGWLIAAALCNRSRSGSDTAGSQRVHSGNRRHCSGRTHRGVPDNAILDNAHRASPTASPGAPRWCRMQSPPEPRRPLRLEGATCDAAEFRGRCYLNEMGSPIASLHMRMHRTAIRPRSRPSIPCRSEDESTRRQDAAHRRVGRLHASACSAASLPSPPGTAGEGCCADRCAACHQPTMRTGPSRIPALDRKRSTSIRICCCMTWRPGRRIAQAAAGTREMRTAPLWGCGKSALSARWARDHNRTPRSARTTARPRRAVRYLTLSPERSAAARFPEHAVNRPGAVAGDRRVGTTTGRDSRGIPRVLVDFRVGLALQC